MKKNNRIRVLKIIIIIMYNNLADEFLSQINE